MPKLSFDQARDFFSLKPSQVAEIGRQLGCIPQAAPESNLQFGRRVLVEVAMMGKLLDLLARVRVAKTINQHDAPGDG